MLSQAGPDAIVEGAVEERPLSVAEFMVARSAAHHVKHGKIPRFLSTNK
jgi:hypothetical protein